MKCGHVCDAGPALGAVCVNEPGHGGPHVSKGEPIPGSKRGMVYQTWQDVFVPFVPDPRDVALCQGSGLTMEECLAHVEADRERVRRMYSQKKKKEPSKV